jgi:hypothetical protein
MGIYGDLLKLNENKTTTPPQPEEEVTPSPTATKATKPKRPKKTTTPRHDTMPPSNRDTTTPRNHAPVVSRYHATTVETIRAAVKLFGKEAATYRFTAEEKKALTNLVYTYRTQGIRTSENVITRVGVNFLIADYEENGENSILHKVLEALNS